MKQLHKYLKVLLCMLVSAVMLFTLVLGGCGEKEDPSPDQDPTIENPEKDSEKDPEKEEEFSVSYRKGYTPKKFGEVTSEITELGEGVHLVANKLQKTNGQDVVVYTIEVDLKKANIVAGTKDNATSDFSYTKTTPIRWRRRGKRRRADMSILPSMPTFSAVIA